MSPAGGPDGMLEPARLESIGPPGPVGRPDGIPAGGPDGVADWPLAALAEDLSEASSDNPTELALPPPCAQTRTSSETLAIAPQAKQSNQDCKVTPGFKLNFESKLEVDVAIWQRRFKNMKIAMAAR